MRMLFAANPTVGHTNFLIALAKQSLQAGDDALFALPGLKSQWIRHWFGNPALHIHEKLEKFDIPYSFLRFSFRQGFLAAQLPHKRGLEEVFHALKVFSASPKHFTRELTMLCEKHRPDAIIYDYTFFPAIAVSEMLSIPRIALYHSGLPFPEYPIPPIGSKARYGEISLADFNAYNKLLEKEETAIRGTYEKVTGQRIKSDFLRTPNSPFLNIVTALPETEYPRNSLPSSIAFAGALAQETIGTSKADVPYFNKRGKKLVYVSLGTVFNKQPKLFSSIISVLHNQDIEIIVAAGSSYETLKKENFNPNVHLSKYVPQLEVLGLADLFITHGGKNSINEALAKGVPMLLFPAGGEQEYNASLVEYLKAGINLAGLSTTASFEEKILQSMETINNSAEIAMSIKRFKELHVGKDGAAKAYQMIRSALKGNRTPR